MQRRTLALLFVSTMLASCLDSVKQDIEQLKAKDRDHEVELKRLAAENETQWSKMNCNSEDVRDFLKACEQGDGSQCSPKAIDGAMAFLDKQDYVSLYLRPDQRAFMMTALRRGLLIKLTRHNYLFPTTRFLIIAQPRGADDEAHQEEARRVGEDISQFLRYELKLPQNRPVLGPYLLPCKSKVNWISHYGDRYDLPQPNEPQDKNNRVRIWVFRTDC